MTYKAKLQNSGIDLKINKHIYMYVIFRVESFQMFTSLKNTLLYKKDRTEFFEIFMQNQNNFPVKY